MQTSAQTHLSHYFVHDGEYPMAYENSLALVNLGNLHNYYSADFSHTMTNLERQLLSH